jgi:trehalose 6-phosphate synthase
VDVGSLRQLGESDEVAQYRAQLLEQAGDRRLIVRVDRTEPSKNIVRGFQAYDELLDEHPEHKEKVQFLALLVPSRLEVEEYQSYLDELMAAAGRVNAHHGTSEWEPVRVMVGESYPRAVAALQLYDVLLVNPVADGMNLVAKEGPVLNQKDGVIVLSERAGAHQQLGTDALVISPCDVYATSMALQEALVMPEDERKQRASKLRSRIEREDLAQWLCWQLTAIHQLGLWEPRGNR